MKKIFLITLVFVLSLSLIACGSQDKKDNSDNTSIQVDKGLINVDVTIPASFFEGMTNEEIQAESEKNGYNKCIFNDDGSVTYTMTKTKHNEMLKDYKKNFDDVIIGFLEGDEKVESFKDIEHNEDLSQIDIYIDPDKYTMWDNLYVLSFYMSGSYYQSFSGVPIDDIDVVVNFIDNNTKETTSTSSYKQYINSMDDEEVDFPVDIDKINTLISKETVLVADTSEFYLDYVQITNDVIPPSPSSWYTHYEADEDRVYVDICISYKNLSTSEIEADDIMDGTVIYAGKYQYKGFSMIEEDNRGDFTYSNITNIAPLSTEYLHYLFELPKEIEKSNGSLYAIINIDNTQYKVIVREGSEEVGSLNPKAIAKSNGTVKNGEVVAIANNSEFYVDFVQITKDVIPPKPGDWYSHYEADDGKVYVDLCVAYKNWETSSVMADDVMSAKLTYAGKYEYRGFSVIEENNRGDLTYSNITGISPLTTEYLHYLFEVPEEVATSSEGIEIELIIEGNKYMYKVR